MTGIKPYIKTKPDDDGTQTATYVVPNMGLARSLNRMGCVIRHHWPDWKDKNRKFRLIKLEYDLVSIRLTLETWIA